MSENVEVLKKRAAMPKHGPTNGRSSTHGVNHPPGVACGGGDAAALTMHRNCSPGWKGRQAGGSKRTVRLSVSSPPTTTARKSATRPTRRWPT